MKEKSESEFAQSCPTLSDPMACSLPGSSVHGISQARVLEWGAVAFSANEDRPTQNDEGTRGKNRNVSRTGSALSGWGNRSKGLIPTSGQLSESEEKHYRLRVKQLICGSLDGMRIRESLPQPSMPWTGKLVS